MTSRRKPIDLDGALLLIARGASLPEAAAAFDLTAEPFRRRLSREAPEAYAAALEARRFLSDTCAHGTYQRYRVGCRCVDCKEACATRQRQMRVKQNPPKHGTRSAYSNHGCRCDPCKEVGVALNRKARNKFRDGEWTASHGTSTRAALGCRCEVCLSVITARVEQANSNNRDSVAGAHKSGQVWTGAEMQILSERTDLSSKELAKMLGRTIFSVQRRRHLINNDPKWMSIP